MHAADDLVPSIKACGVRQPIRVRPAGRHRYEIVYGKRRYQAAKKAGLAEITVTIEELTDEEAHELRVLE